MKLLIHKKSVTFPVLEAWYIYVFVYSYAIYMAVYATWAYPNTGFIGQGETTKSNRNTCVVISDVQWYFRYGIKYLKI